MHSIECRCTFCLYGTFSKKKKQKNKKQNKNKKRISVLSRPILWCNRFHAGFWVASSLLNLLFMISFAFFSCPVLSFYRVLFCLFLARVSLVWLFIQNANSLPPRHVDRAARRSCFPLNRTGRAAAISSFGEIFRKTQRRRNNTQRLWGSVVKPQEKKK